MLSEWAVSFAPTREGKRVAAKKTIQKRAAAKCDSPQFGDPDENRTRVTAVKGRCLNRLTTGPCW